MIQSGRAWHLVSPGRWLTGALVVLAFTGLAINGLLLFRHLSGGGVMGCGGGPCEELLASRWSRLFGVPVTVFGCMAYLGLVVSLTPRGRRFHEPLLGVIAGAALWFVFVQAVVLSEFCSWCMTAHGVGISVLLLGLVRGGFARGFREVLKNVAMWCAAGVLALGLMQFYGPAPETYRIDELAGGLSPSVVRGGREDGRSVSFDGGKKTYQVSALPRLGRADATHVLVEYFDYQCAACRTMAGFVDTLVAKHPAEIAVLLLPVPLERACNPHVTSGNEHSGACESARTALAVWRAAPDAFLDFHRALIADPSPAAARRTALAILSPERLEGALSDPWIDKRIRTNVTDWHAFSQSTDKLPKLLIRERRILHGLPSGEADFIRVMEQELGL